MSAPCKEFFFPDTILGELGGRELGGDPESFPGAALKGHADKSWTQVVFAAGQVQIEAGVTQGAVLVTLRAHQKCQPTTGAGHIKEDIVEGGGRKKKRVSPCKRRVHGSDLTAWSRRPSSTA